MGIPGRILSAEARILKRLWREFQVRCINRDNRAQHSAYLLPCINTNSIFIHSLHQRSASACNSKFFQEISSATGKLKEITHKMSKAGSKNFTVAVEGNIGSGKSTLLKHFENLPYCEVIGEPLDQWTNLEGHNALGLLYEEPQRWSFSFNMYAQLTRIDMHMKPHTQPVKMLERSLYSTRYCFVQNDHINKTINPFEFSVFSQWFDFLTSSGKANIDLIVYLRADPSTCIERIKQRSRKEEAGVPRSFIESLHKLHDDWLLEKKYPVPAPVLVLDANSGLETMKEIYSRRQQEILCGYRESTVL